VLFYLTHPRDAETDVNFARVQAMGLESILAEYDQRHRVLRLRLNGCDMVVDALLGTGTSRPIAAELATLLRQVRGGLQERAGLMMQEQTAVLRPINQPTPAPPRPLVIAVDCPSGLNCDTGALDPLALPADLTITFAGPRPGHLLFPGAAACGRLVVADIGLPNPPALPTQLATAATMRAWLPPRPPGGHKGTFGRVLIAAGSHEYRGAPVLCALGAFRAGAGLVALATPELVRGSAVAQLPEATYPPLATAEYLDNTAASTLLETLSQYRALLVGPGLGSEAEPFVMYLLAGLPTAEQGGNPPVVLDADALNLLAQRADWPHLLEANMVLTPHMGELARLCGLELPEVMALNRLELAREKAVAWGCILLLKGAYTVVANPSGEVMVLPFANPALATAGSGDVLSGVIVALLGQGVAPFAAAVLGAYLHGLAGQLAAESIGRVGLLARDIAQHIPHAIDQLTRRNEQRALVDASQ
jgi:NAD(P)H-hydrate epimerase